MKNRTYLSRLFLEIVVIFIGVYGAFWVERYQQELEDRERAVSILQALQEELREVSDYGPLVVETMAGALREFDDARALGLRVPPAYYREAGAETASTSVWEATVASGGVNLLASELFFDLAAFYNRMESFSQRYLRYNAFTEAELLPRLSSMPEAFYDASSGELDPVFRVHVDQLRILHEEARALVSRADSLVQVVRREGERLH